MIGTPEVTSHKATFTCHRTYSPNLDEHFMSIIHPAVYHEMVPFSRIKRNHRHYRVDMRRAVHFIFIYLYDNRDFVTCVSFIVFIAILLVSSFFPYLSYDI